MIFLDQAPFLHQAHLMQAPMQERLHTRGCIVPAPGFLKDPNHASCPVMSERRLRATTTLWNSRPHTGAELRHKLISGP